jgi:hypothetical protein
MDQRLEATLIGVWKQAMVENAKVVELQGQSYSVQRTTKHGLRQVDFTVDGQKLRGLEQNPRTTSRWADMAREGKKVMQFLSAGQYLAVVADGKVTSYGDRARG